MRNNGLIKIIGVGNGGCNAVNHMYKEGIYAVSFVVCDTDNHALNDSPVPVKLQLGSEGLGAGNRPTKASAAAEDCLDDIHNILNDGTRLAFITAGMGGGTGTGAAPIIARVSKEMGILTVGIVTIPFRFEGNRKIYQAFDGIREIGKHVDALLVIDNERLRKIYPDLSILEAFDKADDTLCVAAKSITEIITQQGAMNLDFNDLKTVLQDGGVAIMSTGYGEGEGCVKKAIDDALKSPLLNYNDIFKSKKILLNISFSHQRDSKVSYMMEELNYVHEFMDKFGDFEIKWGVAIDPELGEKVKVTILATGFGMQNVDGMEEYIAMQQTREEQDRIAEEEERAAKCEKRHSHYYGEGDTAKRYKRRPNIYIFSPKDLDNDDVISAVEKTPTRIRTRDMLSNIFLEEVSKKICVSYDPKSEDWHVCQNKENSFEVYSSIFAPAEVKCKLHMLVQVYLHLFEETESVKALAQESQKDAERRDYIPLQCKLKKGDKVDVLLNIYGETLLMSDKKSIIWQGSFTKCSFDYFVPKDIDVDELSCVAILTVNGVPMGEMRFITKIVESPRQLNTEMIAHKYNKVFISYAHKDEAKVKSFHEGLKLAGIEHFFDRNYLKTGDIFPQVIQDYINTADLFVLFWSENASKSEYVQKERNQALERAFPQVKPQQAAKLSIYPMSIEPRAELPSDMKENYHFGEI